MTTNSTVTVPQVPEIAHQVGESILATVKDHHQRTLDTFESLAEVAAKVTESLPTPTLPSLPGIPAFGDLPSATSVTAFADLKTLTVDGYALAQNLLTAQRDFSLKLIAALTPATSA